jgi:hypothetical protein
VRWRSLLMPGPLLLTGDPVPCVKEQTATVTSASENGALCYLAGSSPANTQVTKFDRAGKRIDTFGPPGDYWSIELSPDGTKLALEEVRSEKIEGDIWILDLSRDIKTQLTKSSTHEWNYCPRWSPDGTEILFSSNRDGSSGQPDSSYGNLYVKASSGEVIETPLLKSKQMKYLDDLSRDGRFVLYTSQITTPLPSDELWVFPLFGERKPMLFLPSAHEGQFSPDGRWVACRSPIPLSAQEEAKANVYVRSFPSGEGKWQISTNGGIMPRWRRNGKELFYLTLDHKLMSVEVKPGANFQFSSPKVLFETPNVDPHRRRRYAVTADGQYFYMLVGDAASTLPQINIVVNWTAELKKQ